MKIFSNHKGCINRDSTFRLRSYELRRTQQRPLSGEALAKTDGMTRGFSFIEMMMAIALLSIVGTSLFLVQSGLFTRLQKAHESVSHMLLLQKTMTEFHETVAQVLKNKQNLFAVKLNKENKNPDFSIAVTIKQPKGSIKVLDKATENIGVINATITDHKKTDIWYSFVHIKKEDESKKQTPKDAKSLQNG